MAETVSEESRRSLEAAAIRVFVINWLGVSPKSRFVKRDSRCGDRSEHSASSDGVTSLERFLSNSRRARTRLAGISCRSRDWRKSRENPISPMIRLSASRIGSFVVRHQTGS